MQSTGCGELADTLIIRWHRVTSNIEIDILSENATIE
jgi:hypothetical protein